MNHSEETLKAAKEYAYHKAEYEWEQKFADEYLKHHSTWTKLVAKQQEIDDIISTIERVVSDRLENPIGAKAIGAKAILKELIQRHKK